MRGYHSIGDIIPLNQVSTGEVVAWKRDDESEDMFFCVGQIDCPDRMPARIDLFRSDGTQGFLSVNESVRLVQSARDPFTNATKGFTP